MKKRIFSLTGIRSDFDLMTPVYQAIQDSDKLELGLIISGAHLSKQFGSTVDLIEQHQFPIIEKIESLEDIESDTSRPISLATQLLTLSKKFKTDRPNLLLTLGDREEALVSGILAQYLNIPLVHISGGDRVVGNVDDQVRHAVSHLAHIHLTTNEDAASRLKKMGEQEFRIHMVGSPGLDRFKSVDHLNKEELSKELGFKINPEKPLLVLLQHPISTEIDKAKEQMEISLSTLVKKNLPTVIIYPNSDAGSLEMIRVIENHRNNKNFYIAKNLPGLLFVNLLRHASVLLGNSSAGILEAPFIGLPVINIGQRQQSRAHGNNVQFVPHNENAIIQAIDRAIFDKDYQEQVKNGPSPYGDGKSTKRIIEILENLEIDSKLLTKDLTY